MAISLISAPDQVVLAKNPVIVRLRALNGSGQPFTAKGPAATMTAGSSSKFTAGQTLTISYTETDGTTETVVLTAAATYTAENKIPDSTFSGTMPQYWEAVRAKVAAHSRIAPFFTIGLSSTYVIKVQATESDTISAMTLANTGSFSVSPIAAVADSTPVNYSALLQIYFEQNYLSGNYALAARLIGQPDKDGYIYFDLSSVLEAECKAHIQEPMVPIWGTNTPQLADNLRRYYFRFTEESGEPVATTDWQYNAISYAVNGGISQRLWADGNYMLAIDDTTSFLTWMADGKKVGLDQPEYLSWFNYTGTKRDIYLFRTSYSRATGAAGTPNQYYAGTISVGAYETAILPISPALVGVSDPDVYKYTIQVAYQFGGEDVMASPARTYYIDDLYYESIRYLNYINGFGCPEVWRCTGEWAKKLKIDRSTAVRPLTPGYNEFAADRYQYGRLWDNELIYRTGYIRKADADVLQELLLAGEIYDVSEDGYIPLQITSSGFDVTSSFRDLHTYQFSTQPRLDMKNYSKKKLIQLSVNAWQEVGGDAWFDAFLIPWTLP